MNKVRIGFIGAGQVADMHMDFYRGIEDAEIVAVAGGSNRQTTRDFAARYGIPAIYDDYHELLARDDIDAVDVCVHSALHAPISIDALRAGKHVYCEKPIALSWAQGRAMLDTARECGKLLHIQFYNLYTKETKAARRIVETGRLGRIYHARSSGFRRRGRPYVDGYGTPNFVRKNMSAGGALCDAGVYNIAQILYLIGQPEVLRVNGKIYQELDMDEQRREISGYDVEEMALGTVRFAGNRTMEVSEAWAAHLNPFEGSYILGSEGGLRLDPLSFHSMLGDMAADTTVDLDQSDVRRHRLDPQESAYDSSQMHWVRALQGRVELLPTAELALGAQLIIEGIYLSDALGREVSVEEIQERSLPLPQSNR